MNIENGGMYRIKGKSKYFKGKYGTSNPLIVIEDTDKKVFGGSWMEQNGNTACCLFGYRAGVELLPVMTNKVYYGKISMNNGRGALGELVCGSELESI